MHDVATTVMSAGAVVCTPAELLIVMGDVPDLVIAIVVVTLWEPRCARARVGGQWWAL